MKNSTILRLNFEKDNIDTSPSYQRLGDIWTLEKKQLLIDSILNDFDLPKLYFHVLKSPTNLENGKTVSLAIIDGRQRLETIWSFLDDKFSLAPDFELYKDPNMEIGGLKYSQIANQYPHLKILFDSFVLPIICVETDSIDLIDDMFSRLNEAVPLNAAEKRNAFGGPLPKIINNLSKHPFFTKFIHVRNTRYQHRELATRLLFLEDCMNNNKIIDTKKAYLDNFVKKHKFDSNLNGKSLSYTVQNILDEMQKVFTPTDSLLTIIGRIQIYYALFNIAIKQDLLSNITREKLLKFNDLITQNRIKAEKNIGDADFELLEFNRLSSQYTNDASGIKERIRIISKFFKLTEIIL